MQNGCEDATSHWNGNVSRFRFSLSVIWRAVILSSLLATTYALHAQSLNFTDVKPSPQQVEWQDLQFGVIIHFGPNTLMNREWGDGTASPSVFDPTDVDPEQWMRGVRAAVLNASFLWQSIMMDFACGQLRRPTIA